MKILILELDILRNLGLVIFQYHYTDIQNIKNLSKDKKLVKKYNELLLKIHKNHELIPI